MPQNNANVCVIVIVVFVAGQVREELLYNVLEPISHPERFTRLGLDVPAGVLFFGPPG
jgi:ATP-dependent 26S proteasome regulatory subunit